MKTYYVERMIVREILDSVKKPNKVVCDHFNDKKYKTG